MRPKIPGGAKSGRGAKLDWNERAKRAILRIMESPDTKDADKLKAAALFLKVWGTEVKAQGTKRELELRLKAAAVRVAKARRELESIDPDAKAPKPPEETDDDTQDETEDVVDQDGGEGE